MNKKNDSIVCKKADEKFYEDLLNDRTVEEALEKSEKVNEAIMIVNAFGTALAKGSKERRKSQLENMSFNETFLCLLENETDESKIDVEMDLLTKELTCIDERYLPYKKEKIRDAFLYLLENETDKSKIKKLQIGLYHLEEGFIKKKIPRKF